MPPSSAAGSSAPAPAVRWPLPHSVSCGFFVSALGVHFRQLRMLYLGYGVLGGIGLGLGYVSPVSTLIKWFADRPGLATGLAIMGFGGGAMIGGPLAVSLMGRFKTDAGPGAATTFVIMGVLYGLFMFFGAFLVCTMINSRSLDAPAADAEDGDRDAEDVRRARLVPRAAGDPRVS